jgi:hypothetical protein
VDWNRLSLSIAFVITVMDTEIGLGGCGLDSSVSEYGFCDHGNGPCSTKCGEFDYLWNRHLLKVGSVPWSRPVIRSFSLNIFTLSSLLH